MKSIKDCYTLSNGIKIPCIGFGTHRTGTGARDALLQAVEHGYRFFDTASLYANERFLGQGIKESGIKREELFIQSKLWIDERGYKQAKEALERSLTRLGVDYLDLYLIHWPKGPGDGEAWKEIVHETMRAMEDCRKEGLIKGAGVSNFLPHHLEEFKNSDVPVPLVDQLELHVGYMQPNAVNYCKEHSIIPQAWSPLVKGRLTEDEIIGRIASKYGKSVAQICVRYLMDKGIIPLVKAASVEHMKENMDVFDFELSFADTSLLDSYPYNLWLGEHPDFVIPTKVSDFNQ